MGFPDRVVTGIHQGVAIGIARYASPGCPEIVAPYGVVSEIDDAVAIEVGIFGGRSADQGDLSFEDTVALDTHPEG